MSSVIVMAAFLWLDLADPPASHFVSSCEAKSFLKSKQRMYN
jgi:hypothetical protein